MHIDYDKNFKEHLEYLRELGKSDPEYAKKLAKDTLMLVGILNSDGSEKEYIVNESHIGYDEEPVSYEKVVTNMKNCLEDIRLLGNDDPKKTRELIIKSLMDSEFIDGRGHIITFEKRSPQVEEFFRRFDLENNISGRQRIRK